jgi:hypothetical protein
MKTLGSVREEATGRKGLQNEELRGLNPSPNYACYGNQMEDEVDDTRSPLVKDEKWVKIFS